MKKSKIEFSKKKMREILRMMQNTIEVDGKTPFTYPLTHQESQENAYYLGLAAEMKLLSFVDAHQGYRFTVIGFRFLRPFRSWLEDHLTGTIALFLSSVAITIEFMRFFS